MVRADIDIGSYHGAVSGRTINLLYYGGRGGGVRHLVSELHLFSRFYYTAL